MTKFVYAEHQKPSCVAYICHFEDDPNRPILVLKNDDGKNTYIYHDGEILTQGVDCEKNAVYKFYRGDRVTIIF